ncbi:MAG: sugar transferase [Planctomycetes bacterium]|nr:sugar transferase [Planctomycetota bacterium]
MATSRTASRPPRTSLAHAHAAPSSVAELARASSTELGPCGGNEHAHLERAIDWDTALPRGFYARRGRAWLDLALVAGACVPVLVLGTLVAAANLCCFRDPRKVLYVQPRVGHRGRVFHILKFRTMREPRRSAHDSWSSGEDGARVTSLGRFLRSTHLDELPQFVNILRGEMSFIGPRPEMVEVESWANEHVPGFARRLVLRPGITGYAQITQGYTGRSVEAYAEKLAINDHYLGRLSLATDLGILARTALWMVRGRGWQWREQAAGSGGRSAPSRRVRFVRLRAAPPRHLASNPRRDSEIALGTRAERR